VVRHDGSSGEVRVHYTTTPGTAHLSPHQSALYVPSSGYLVYSDGGLGRQTLSVTLLDNGQLEGPRTFFVNITRLELIEPRLDSLVASMRRLTRSFLRIKEKFGFCIRLKRNRNAGHHQHHPCHRRHTFSSSFVTCDLDLRPFDFKIV